MYPCGHKQRSAQMPGSMGASGRGTDKAIGFAALADVAEELRELQRLVICVYSMAFVCFPSLQVRSAVVAHCSAML